MHSYRIFSSGFVGEQAASCSHLPYALWCAACVLPLGYCVERIYRAQRHVPINAANGFLRIYTSQLHRFPRIIAFSL